MKSSQRLYKKCRLFRSCPRHVPRRTVFYTAVNCDPVQGQGSSRRRRLRPVLRHLPAVALRPAALGLVAGVAAVPGGGRHGPARHRQLQRPLRRPGLRLRLRRAVLRRRVLLIRRRRPQPARVLVAAVRRRAPRVQPVFLQQWPEKNKKIIEWLQTWKNLQLVCMYYVCSNPNQEEEEDGSVSLRYVTCRWLLTSSLVSPSTFISSLICFGVATAVQTIRHE